MKFPDISSVYFDGSFIYIVHAHQQLCDCRFSRSGPTNYCQNFPGFDLEGNVLERFDSCIRIGKAYIVESNVTINVFYPGRAGSDGRLGFQELIDPLLGGCSPLHEGGNPGQRHSRESQLIDIHDKLCNVTCRNMPARYLQTTDIYRNDRAGAN